MASAKAVMSVKDQMRLFGEPNNKPHNIRVIAPPPTRNDDQAGSRVTRRAELPYPLHQAGEPAPAFDDAGGLFVRRQHRGEGDAHPLDGRLGPVLEGRWLGRNVQRLADGHRDPTAQVEVAGPGHRDGKEPHPTSDRR